jgi:hypothetical protein
MNTELKIKGQRSYFLLSLALVTYEGSVIICRWIFPLEKKMASDDLNKLHDILRKALVEVEIAIDTQTYPDWADTKENLLRGIEITRRLERDQIWSKLSKK